VTAPLRTRPGLWLFILLVCAYAATFGGRLYSGDGIEMWRTAAGLLLRGDLALEQDSSGRSWGYPGPDGRRYSPYALGLSLAEVPFVAAGKAAGALLPLDERRREQVDWAAAVAVNLFVTAGCGLLVYLIGAEAGFGLRAAVSAAVLYGLGTMAWVYSKHDFAEPLCALALAGAVWLLLRYRRDPRAWLLAAAGAMNGYTFFTKYQMVVYSPILVVWLLLATDLRTRRVRDLLRPLAVFLVPGLLFGIANLAVNHARFGTWMSTGYGNQGAIFAGWTHVPTGLFGLLLSPGKGLFWYCPLVLASLFAWPAFHRRSPVLSLLSAAIAAATILMFAPLWWWHGDWAWGPRYLVIPLPFMVLPLLGWLDRTPGGVAGRAQALRRRALIAFLLVAAIAVNFLGITVNFFFPLQAYSDAGMVHDRWNFVPGLSPLRYHLHVVRSWLARARGQDAEDFVYVKWRDGELSEERIPSGEYLKDPDFFFFRPRGSRAEQGALSLVGLLFVAGAWGAWRKLGRSLETLSP
jgi:hypothetical protein